MLYNENLIWPDSNYLSHNARLMRHIKHIDTTEYWPTMRKIFEHDCATLPLPAFRIWASIMNVPLVTTQKTSRFLGESFYAASKDSRIAKALEENYIGVPPGYLLSNINPVHDFPTSMQRVQNVAHLLIAGFTPEDISGYKSIVEIGAGYGDMCSVVHSLGFKGEYTIVDIPEIIPVQNYYLNNQNIFPKYSFEDDNVSHADLVIATWSLSETPLEYRAKLIPKIINSKNWLIMAQSHFHGNNVNDEYFNNLFADRNMTKIPLSSPELDKWDGGNNYYVVRI